MTHPTDQLTDYVDGSLTDDAAEELTRHLATCAACRADVKIAALARRSLAALPDPGTPDLVGAVQGKIRAAEAIPIDRRWQRVAGWAAAAAVVVLVVVALPRIGSGPDESPAALTAEDAGGAAIPESTQGGDLVLELEQIDYDQASVLELASGLAQDGGVERSSGQGSEASASAPVIGAGDVAKRAARCVARSAPGEPIRLISATYEGAPAYLAIYLEGPAADRPVDTVKIWVVSTKGCDPLSLATARI